jgi:hypothetical protein
VFDLVEGAVGPLLARAVATDEFIATTRRLLALQKEARASAERLSRRLWHGLNLPAGSDVRRLERQISRLERTIERQEHGDDVTRVEPEELR